MTVLLGQENRVRGDGLLQDKTAMADIITLERLLDSSFTPDEFEILTDLLAGNSKRPQQDAQSLSQSILERSSSTALRLNDLMQHSRRNAIAILKALGENYELPHNLALEIKISGFETNPIIYHDIQERDVY